MRKYVLAALLAGSFAAPAMAQEAAPFTGFRAEGLVGYESVEVPGNDSDGVTYGAGIGYDFQMGNLVAGIEGEVTDSTVDECTSDFAVAGDELCAEAGRDLYVGGRLGTLIGANTLLYGKAGYTNARIETEYTNGPDIPSEVSENLDGVRVGAGLEFAVGPNSYLKTEYRYSNYEQGFDKHQGLVGFGFRF